MIRQHSFSNFYLTQSVFRCAGEKIRGGELNDSYSFLFYSILFYTKNKKNLFSHLIFSPLKLTTWAKSVEFENEFKGFMVLGEHMFKTELPTDGISGNINEVISSCANFRNSQIKGDVKIVCDDKETLLFFNKRIADDDFPYTVISSKEALEELREIDEKIKQKLSCTTTPTTEAVATETPTPTTETTANI